MKTPAPWLGNGGTVPVTRKLYQDVSVVVMKGFTMDILIVISLGIMVLLVVGGIGVLLASRHWK